MSDHRKTLKVEDIERDGFMLSSAGRKYIQLWEIICGPGTDRIRENVLHNLDQPTLRQSLDARRHIFKRLLKQNKIYDKQFATLFPRNRQSREPDHSSIDISLWVTICKTVTIHRKLIDYSRPLTDTDVAWEHDAIRLRDARNYLSHLIQPKFTDEDYQRQSTIVRQALMRLGVADEELSKLFSTDDSDYVLSEEAKNYLRLRVLVVEVGTERIRRHILQNLNFASLREAVKVGRETLYSDINPSQRDVLYPTGRQTFETDVDISLWTLVLRKLWAPPAGVTVDWNGSPRPDQLEWFHDMCRVRDVRNRLVHLPKPSVTSEEFAERWAELAECLVRLGAERELIASYLRQDFYGMETHDIHVEPDGKLRLMSRSQWGAASPVRPLQEFGTEPAQCVVIGHLVYAKPCHNTHECSMLVRNIQRYETEEKGYDDIIFNYLVANDGVVYEGRGLKYHFATGQGEEVKVIPAAVWSMVPITYGVAFVGQFDSSDAHCQRALQTARLLFMHLQRLGRLNSDFTVYGIRQIAPEHDSPKMDLYEEIKKWPEWREYNVDIESMTSDGADYN